MIASLAPPSSLRDGEVSLVPIDERTPALLVAASQDPEITRWTHVPSNIRLLDARLLCAGWAGARRIVRLMVCLPSLAPAGMVALFVNEDGEAEVGYWLLAEARGRGAGRRAAGLVVDWAFVTCGVTSVQLTTLPGNVASERVAAACGFERAGTVTREVQGRKRTLQLWRRTRAHGEAGASV